jgi:FkbM family methyltransferase
MLKELLKSFPESKSQYAQDMFALCMSNTHGPGYFVEFGATDGITGSNTYLLEKVYGWNGLLVEPSRQFHDKLYQNRSCHIDERCISSISGKKLDFQEVHSSGISHVKDKRNLSLLPSPSRYSVQSVTLTDLLVEVGAPSFIDYLSIDVEGHELAVLSGLDFDKYQFGCITVEHNYSHDSSMLKQIFLDNGYVSVFEDVSFYDFWFVSAAKYNQLLAHT